MRLCLILTVVFLFTGCTSKYKQLYEAKPGFYSYIVGNVHSNYFDEEYFSKVYSTPASCQKVVTSLIALKTLGPEYKYKTELFITKKGNKIYNLIIRFSGDPTLTSEQLTALLQPLRNTNVSRNIVLDASLFATSPYSPNLMIGDIGTNYATPVSSINIDKNLVAVKILPNKIGELAIIQTDIGYIGHSKVITNNEKTSVKLTWVGDIIEAEGNINSADSLLELKIAPQNHDRYVLNKIKSILLSLNINGKMEIINDPILDYQTIKPINTVESPALSEIIKLALKQSDNLIFDSIYLSVIHSNSDKTIKEWKQGSDIIKKLINQHFGIDTQRALFVDGSGLSRYNRIQPITLLLLLKKGFNTPEFVNALAIPGDEQSTLKDYTALPSSIRAKTGKMSGISCLCGYSFSARNPKAFVFMSNSFAPPSKELREVMDNFISKNIGQ